MEQKKEEKKEKSIILIILILLALVIIIFLLIRFLGLIEHSPRIPTGNVDIFDILFGNTTTTATCCCNCNCHNQNSTASYCEECKDNTAHCSGNNDNSNDYQDDYQEPDEPLENVIVYDDDVTYTRETPLRIFTQTSYHVIDDKIAPTSENSYQFVIRNHNDFHIRYDLEMIELNKYHINMQYRLKQNGKYVVGNDNTYVSASELQQYAMNLAQNAYDVYTLDWKWFESENDTEIGTNIEASYQLNLKITAISYAE